MYHAIVRRVVRRNDEPVNRHDFAPVPAGCAPDIRHRFGGDHAPGGERNDRDAFGRWLERLARLAPDLRIDVDDVWGFLAAEADRGVAEAGAEKITS